MSKPMSDGGKGSVRRNEDNDAYRNNFDAIFGAKAPKSSPSAAGKKEKEQPMMNDDHKDFEQGEDDSEWCCDVCGGPMYRQPHWGYAQCDDCGARQELIDDDYT